MGVGRRPADQFFRFFRCVLDPTERFLCGGKAFRAATPHQGDIDIFDSLLLRLSSEASYEALGFFVTITRNVTLSPDVKRFRCLPISNEKFAALLRLPGALELMQCMGWQERSGYLILPMDERLDEFPRYVNKLNEARQRCPKQRDHPVLLTSLGRPGSRLAMRSESTLRPEKGAGIAHSASTELQLLLRERRRRAMSDDSTSSQSDECRSPLLCGESAYLERRSDVKKWSNAVQRYCEQRNQPVLLTSLGRPGSRLSMVSDASLCPERSPTKGEDVAHCPSTELQLLLMERRRRAMSEAMSDDSTSGNSDEAVYGDNANHEWRSDVLHKLVPKRLDRY